MAFDQIWEWQQDGGEVLPAVRRYPAGRERMQFKMQVTEYSPSCLLVGFWLITITIYYHNIKFNHTLNSHLQQWEEQLNCATAVKCGGYKTQCPGHWTCVLSASIVWVEQGWVGSTQITQRPWMLMEIIWNRFLYSHPFSPIVKTALWVGLINGLFHVW